LDIRLTLEQVEALRQIDICALANAIEKYQSNSPDPQTSEAGDEIKNFGVADR